jgi:hypothetical protein
LYEAAGDTKKRPQTGGLEETEEENVPCGDGQIIVGSQLVVKP